MNTQSTPPWKPLPYGSPAEIVAAFKAGTRFVLAHPSAGIASPVRGMAADSGSSMPLLANGQWLFGDGRFHINGKVYAYLAMADSAADPAPAEASSSPVTAADEPGIKRAADEPAEALTPEEALLQDMAWLVGDDRKAAALLDRARALYSPPPTTAPPERGIGFDITYRDRRWS